jgi:predicted nucleotide-binding protein (sugar kinase/HSP70/actin superfamily)
MLNLLEKKPDFIFMPVQCTMEKLSGDFKKSWNCPTQSLSYYVKSTHINEALTMGYNNPKILRPVRHPDRGQLG